MNKYSTKCMVFLFTFLEFACQSRPGETKITATNNTFNANVDRKINV